MKTARGKNCAMPVSRRCFLGMAASTLASGCLYGFIKEIPRGPAKWPVFRFAAVGELGLSHSGPPDRFRFAHDAAEKIASTPDLDFVVTAGNITGSSDHLSHMLATEIAHVSGERWYCSKAPEHEIHGFHEGPSPYAASPVEGVVVCGLSPADGEGADSSAPFLSGKIEERAGDFIIAVLESPLRLPDGHGKPGKGADTLRYILDAAQEVKIAISTSKAPPSVHVHSGLIHVCVPPPSEFPHAIAVFTVAGHGVEIEFVPFSPDWMLETERTALAALPEAKAHDPSDPKEYVKWRAGPAGEAEYATR